MVYFFFVCVWALVGAPLLVVGQPNGEQVGDMKRMMEENTTVVEIMDNSTTTEPAATDAISPSPAPTSSKGPVMKIDDLPLMTVDEVILSDPDITTLAAAFNASGLIGVLCENCNYTVFAPDNDAFAALDQDLLAKLLTPPWILHLQDLLAYHATYPSADRVLAADLIDGMSLAMLNYENTTVDVDAASGSVSVESYGESSNVVSPDNVALNGNVHIVDTVLTPSFLVTDLITLIESVEGYSILAQLVNFTELALPNGMDFTLLAPNDSAFGKLGNETLQSLLDDDEQLTTFLSNHIVAGVIPSVALMDGATVSSINGYNITVSVDGDVVMINEAMVVDKDMLANNGILHGIDAVLSTDNTSPSLSPSFSVSPSSSSNPAPAPVGSPVSDDSPSPDASSPTDPPVTESAPTSPVLPPVSGVDVASSRLSALGAVLGAVIAMLQLL